MRFVLVVIALSAACFPPPRELEGLACVDDSECLSEFGYACVDAVCIFVPPADAGPVDDDAGP